MLAYLVNLIHAFVPMAILAGVSIAVAWDRDEGRARWFCVASIACGIAAGFLTHGVALDQGAMIAARTFLSAAASGAAIVLFVGALAARSASGAMRRIFQGAVMAGLAVATVQAMFWYLTAVSNQGLSVTSVLNTELILNVGAIITGILLVAALLVVMARSARNHTALAVSVLAATVLLLLFAWGNGVILGLLQLQMLDVTSGRISFVAKSSEWTPLAVYAELVCALALGATRFLRSFRGAASEEAGRIARRKLRATALSERRWWRGAVATVSFLAVSLLYHDLYASLPPSLSPAEEVTPDSAGQVRIPIESVKDGNLHRFAYVTSDGHRVRFFLINRYDAEHVKIGVVFDACMICGDDGYIQRGGEIICIACNVRIFVPSIGKPGGCNPIPLDHEADGETISIPVSNLEKGAKYFSEVVEIEVEDPVTGAHILNLTSPHQYEYKGRTFYFEGPESYEKFKNDPDRYAGDIVARSYRVQGYQQ